MCTVCFSRILYTGTAVLLIFPQSSFFVLRLAFCDFCPLGCKFVSALRALYGFAHYDTSFLIAYAYIIKYPSPTVFFSRKLVGTAFIHPVLPFFRVSLL